MPTSVSRIFFVSLLTSSVVSFLSSAYPHLTSSDFIIIALLVPPPYLFIYLAATSTASKITPATHNRHMTIYPYDHTLFHPRETCRTCKLPKPARSKHCPICRVCVARCDHHCVWLNNCVGRDNQRYFLALLLSLTILLTYGAWLGYTLMRPRLGVRKKTGIMSYFDVWGPVIQGDVRLGAVALLAGLCMPLPLGLFVYHVYLVWAGMTTNETNKWRILQEEMADGLVFKNARSKEQEVHRRGTLDEPATDWPIAPTQWIARTKDGKPPEQQAGSEADQGKWERCWRLRDVDNIYDLGFWDNLRDVLLLPIS
ncbi:hypothetical protein MRB53_041572 [Persea americana]|nr:hypothetical protein MRB53_041572 [Persea americana]